MILNIKKWFIIFLFGLVGCASSSFNANSTPLPTLQARPEFILGVAPRELQILSLTTFTTSLDEPNLEVLDDWDDITLTGYDSLICLKVEMSLLAEVGDDFIEGDIVKERVAMLIDGSEVNELHVTSVLLQSIHVVDTNGQYLMKGVEPKLICGKVSPTIGVHEVLFQFRQTSGSILEYRWQFALTEN